MRVVVFIVNYHADDHLVRFVNSLRAAEANADGLVVDVCVFDNSGKPTEGVGALREALRSAGDRTDVHSSGRNDGYFGPLSAAQAMLPDEADVVVYCNPDLILEEDFFVELEAARETGAVVAPAIISIADGFDQNPKYVRRLSASKLRRLETIYSSSLAFFAYRAAARVKEVLFSRSTGQLGGGGMEIYAPHGALFVFTDPHFFRRLPRYPCFLFGEELFVAEEARRAGVSVVYNPRLRVKDVRHASVAGLGGSRLRRYMLDSVQYILATYYDRLSTTS